jgi:hypothetical protein
MDGCFEAVATSAWSRRWCTPTALVACVMMLGPSGAQAQNVVPNEFHGTWIPAKAGCDSPLKVVVTGDRLTLANGKDTQSLGGIEMAGPAYFPPGYRGIMAVLFTEFSGHQPVILHFNAAEKKGVAQAELGAPISSAPTAHAKAYNAHIAKLNLAKRFPLDKVILKKCP